MCRSILLFTCLTALFVTSSWAFINCYECTEREDGEKCLDPVANSAPIKSDCNYPCITIKHPSGRIERKCPANWAEFRNTNRIVPLGTCGRSNDTGDWLDTCVCEGELCNNSTNPFPTVAPIVQSETIDEVSESGAMTIVKSSGFLVVAGLWAALARLGQ